MPAPGPAEPAAERAGRGSAPGAVSARGLIREWLQFGQVGGLLLASRQPPLVALRRAALIRARVRLVAAAFAILTLAWIPLDLLLLPFDSAFSVASARALAGAALAWLALSAARRNTIRGAYAALALLFAIPTWLFAFALGEIYAGTVPSVLVEPLAALYGYIPVIAVMGLSLFPLTLIEVLAFAAPVFLVDAAAGLVVHWGVPLGATVADIWLVVLAAGISALACASQLSLMLALMGQSMRDPLTKAFSRASMEELLELQCTAAQRSGAPLALAFLDLDHFKAINDGFGHDAGDAVLEETAARLRSTLRRTDLVGRWGGEEFVALLPNTPLAQAVQVLERLRAQGLGSRPDGRRVTASIGLAELRADRASSGKALVECADARMYRAKHAGRDRLVAE